MPSQKKLLTKKRKLYLPSLLSFRVSNFLKTRLIHQRQRLSIILLLLISSYILKIVIDYDIHLWSMNFQNSHAICDLGLAITERLVQKDVDLQKLSHSMPLPPMLYKAFEKKEGDDTMVCFFLSVLYVKVFLFILYKMLSKSF